MRPVLLVLVLYSAALVAFLATFADAAWQTKTRSGNQAASIDLVTRLGLTDLALFSEARYTRHPSQADLHSALQDHPAAFEHFPSGSFVQPPALSR